MEGQAPFELRLVQVRWAGPKKPISLETAWAPIPLVKDKSGEYLAEVLAYPELSPRRQCQFAVSTPDLQAAPELLLSDNSCYELFPVVHNGRTWWIECGDWDKDKGYHDAPTCRHVGTARIEIGADLLRVSIFPPGFTEVEFSELLEEFRNGLWQLILDPKSPTTASTRRRAAGVSQAFTDAVRNLIKHTERALQKPHLELREKPMQQPLSKVRPSIRTFQELAQRGAPRFVTGRGHAPSHDTPENRQLLGMISRVDRSLRAMLRASHEVASDFQRRADAAAAQAKSLDGWIHVAPEKLAQDISELEADLAAWTKAAHRFTYPPPPDHTVDEAVIQVNSELEVDCAEASTWVKVLEWNKFPDEYGIRLRVLKNSVDAEKVFRKGERYRIRGSFDRRGKFRTNATGWRWCKCDLTGIEIIQNQKYAELNKLRGTERDLKLSGYRQLLSHKKKEEQEKDRKTYLKQEQRLLRAKGEWEEHGSSLEPLVIQTGRLVKQARSLGISAGIDLRVTGSMTYVQNADYRGALAAYRQALDAAGLDTSQIERLFRLDDIGILDLPIIYERWCLLKIVRVLLEEFHLIPEARYRDQLLKQLAEEWEPKATLTIKFEAPHLLRDVVVSYQPRIASGRTPDFIISVKPRPEAPPVPDGIMGSKLYDEHKLVLDAKCKPFVPISSNQPGLELRDEFGELLRVRKYDENGRNRVFVIHPGPSSDSPEEWRRYCRYGGGHFTPEPDNRPGWDDGAPHHRHGAVLVRPGVLDPLVRLILMHLYMSLDNTLGAYNKRPPRFDPFCPACGGTELTDKSPPNQTGSKHVTKSAHWCAAPTCRQMIVRNNCGNCGSHLWKLGGYWTFHETRALDPYDIKCYHCGEYRRDAESDDWPGVGFEDVGF